MDTEKRIKFKMTAVFEEDRPSVTDRWGMGLKFYILPSTHPQVVRRGRDRGLKDEDFKRVAEGVNQRRRDLRARVAAEEEAKGRGEAADEDLIDLKGTAVLAEFQDTTDRLTTESVVDRVTGWEGVLDEGGAAVAYGHAPAVQLFSDETVVPPDLELGGMTVGAALQKLIIDASKALAGVEEEAGESSGPAEGGTLPSGENSETSTKGRSSDS